MTVGDECTFRFCWVMLYEVHSSRKISTREDLSVGQGRQTVEVRGIISRCVDMLITMSMYEPCKGLLSRYILKGMGDGGLC